MEHTVQPNCLKQKLSKPFASQCRYLLCVSGRLVFVDCVVYWTSGWHCEWACALMRVFVPCALIRNKRNTWQWRRGCESQKNVQIYYCYRDDREFWWDSWEMGNFCGTGGTVFFLANNIEEDRQVPPILSLIGSKTYTLLRDLLSPDKPATKSFQEIFTTLQ